MAANVNECAVIVCDEDNHYPVTNKWKRGEDYLLVLDQYLCLGVDFSKDCRWDTRIAKIIEKIKSKSCSETMTCLEDLFQCLKLQRRRQVSDIITFEEDSRSFKNVYFCGQPNHGNGGEKPEGGGEEKRKIGVRSYEGGADRHLNELAQCPSYGQMYSTGSCTY